MRSHPKIMSDTFYPSPRLDSPDPNYDAELIKQLGFVPGLKEFIITRQIHALEHGTVWMLSNATSYKARNLATSYLSADNETIGGLSTEKGFYLYGEINPVKLRQAVTNALRRLQQGEWNLALHPRCGTNSSVAVMLTTGMAMMAHMTLPKEPMHQIMGMGLATIAANYLAPDVGIYVQKYITTAIPFNLKVNKITRITDKAGNSGYFVRLNWIEN